MTDKGAKDDQAGGAAEAPEQGAQAPAMPRVAALGQFIRDLSFENAAAMRGSTGQVQPEIGIHVEVDAQPRSEPNHYTSIIRLRIEAKEKEGGAPIFLLEIDYAGIFRVENVPQEQLHPFLHIECPRLMFPFLRRIVHDLTRDGGYPPLNLENMDFLALYQASLARRQQEAQGGGAEGAQTH